MQPNQAVHALNDMLHRIRALACPFIPFQAPAKVLSNTTTTVHPRKITMRDRHTPGTFRQQRRIRFNKRSKRSTLRLTVHKGQHAPTLLCVRAKLLHTRITNVFPTAPKITCSPIPLNRFQRFDNLHMLLNVRMTFCVTHHLFRQLLHHERRRTKQSRRAATLLRHSLHYPIIFHLTPHGLSQPPHHR